MITMKFNPFITSDHSKNHKCHFNAPLHMCHKVMFSPLSKELQQKYNICFLPTTRTMRSRWFEDMTKQGGHHRLKLDKDREKILERKAKSRQVGNEKGKYKEELTEKIQE
ncbi:60S ribosomal protein L26-like 1 [Myotis davidii]|uniref:60S ribosomal protein L26-like 1 n=1 Tax=Myotis davidii TaxID=225400 RepID=L5MBV1_MYODS|nr:60S ribosomal protein L26-like 1 [Myotis davidii]